MKLTCLSYRPPTLETPLMLLAAKSDHSFLRSCRLRSHFALKRCRKVAGRSYRPQHTL